MKHLVAAGCSFTSLSKPNMEFPVDIEIELKHKSYSMYTWIDWLRYYNKDKYKVYNYGCPTNDNDTIVESVLYGINNLIKDDTIDNLLRTFCVPEKDNIIICPPTYPMYEVSAQVNNIAIQKAPLLANYQLNIAHIEQLVNNNTKIIWICSPNNPTGNAIDRIDIETILNHFNGLVVIDEAYINFSKQASFASSLIDYPNLVVLQTLSKAWGLAGLRLGMAFASKEIVAYMNKVKAPYNINIATQELVLQALEEVGQVNDMIMHLVDMRMALAEVIASMPCVEKVYPSDTNFLLVKIPKASQLYQFLLEKGIVVRDRSSLENCADTIRITVGNEQENTQLVDAMAAWIDLNFPDATV